MPNLLPRPLKIRVVCDEHEKFFKDAGCEPETVANCLMSKFFEIAGETADDDAKAFVEVLEDAESGGKAICCYFTQAALQRLVEHLRQQTH